MLYKKTLSLLCAGLICFGSAAIPDGDEGQTVPISLSTTHEHSIPPKSPSLVPIGCIYYPSVSTLSISFLDNLGTVSFELENQTSGALFQTTINATPGVFPFQFSGGIGLYVISFSLVNGDIYTGSFQID